METKASQYAPVAKKRELLEITETYASPQRLQLCGILPERKGKFQKTDACRERVQTRTAGGQMARTA